MADDASLVSGTVAAPTLTTFDAAALSAPLYFPVSTTKLVVMSLCTLSLYQIYWFYKNWWHVKEREPSTIRPALRSLFAIFFCYSLFSKVRKTASENSINVYVPAGNLATLWILSALLSGLPDPYWLIGFLAIFLLVPVQIATNQINARMAPIHDRNERFSAGNIATVVIGGLFLIAAVFAAFVHPS